MEAEPAIRFPQTNNELESFALNLFSSSMTVFGLRAPHQIYPSPFQSDEVIHAVVSLQFYMRDTLRKCFNQSIDVMEGMTRESIGMEKIERLMASMKPYLDCDIFNFALNNLALMAELLLYLRHIDLSVSLFWFIRIWVFLYRRHLEKKMEEEGGWIELIRTAKRRYRFTGLYEEIQEEFQKLVYPYQSFTIPLETQRELFQVNLTRTGRMTRATTALKVMRLVYTKNPILRRQRMWHELQHEQRRLGEERQLEEVPEQMEEQDQAADMQVVQQEAPLSDEDGWC
ncbi:hypothetical protein TNIN_276131 [Trichonephila inaurata madagascariensis]|uniref:Uncharacterized protein n=1 Tax=Trichonephila inaurata madagascariensis TaxID=2747483 RepID=A0A8X6XTF1_9ARAC|nr:hypothetical protein TNIN_276131 [Trichonephila inaurata madagascariensis]